MPLKTRTAIAITVTVLGIAFAPPSPTVWVLKPMPRLDDLPPLPQVERISVRITYYNLVPAQTDSTPDIGSCGHREHFERIGYVLVALSRDLFYKNGSKRCGELVTIYIGHTVYRGIVWDTTHGRFRRTVDIAKPPNKRWEYGMAYGLMVRWR